VGREVWIATPMLAPFGERLDAFARRARVADLPGLRAHFESN
jgi:hypothetical protein